MVDDFRTAIIAIFFLHFQKLILDDLENLIFIRKNRFKLCNQFMKLSQLILNCLTLQTSEFSELHREDCLRLNLRKFEFRDQIFLRFVISFTFANSFNHLINIIQRDFQAFKNVCARLCFRELKLSAAATNYLSMGDEFMKRGATLHGCDVRTRDAFANMDIAGYNYGIYRYKHDLKKYPNRLILGSETFCNDAYRFREQAKKNPRLVGDFVWAGMDYLGEVGVGSWEYKAYATQFSGLGWTTAGSGRIDLNGRPLGEALYTRVALEQEIGPYIAVRPVMFSGEKHSPSAWKMTDAMPSWSWAGCEGKKAHIEVYARAAKVALLLNGKKVAEKQLKNDCLAKFTIPYQSGTLEAVSYDAIDRVLGRCKLQTAGADTVLRAVPEEKKTKPGRLCYIRIRYTDRAGELKPMERGMVNITVSGGKLLAAGSACPFHPGSYLTPETDTYYGEALAVVEAGESGAVEVSISDGERSDTVKIPIA